MSNGPADHPLQMITPHPDLVSIRKVMAKTVISMTLRSIGYGGWTRLLGDRINPADAEVRGIRMHDVVKVHNQRGAVLCAAKVTERVRIGTMQDTNHAQSMSLWANLVNP